MATLTPIPDDAPAWAIRLEAKVDVVLAQHEADIRTLQRDLANAIQTSERNDARLEAKFDALDSRVDVVERTPFVTTKSLTGAMTATVALVVGILTILQYFTR